MVRKRDAGFRLATRGVPEGRGTVTGQGAFLAPPAVCVVMSFSAVRDRCNQH